MDFTLVVPAFVAGILTFLAPCTLPLVPAYLGFISGTSAEDLKDPAKLSTMKRRIFLNGVFYVLGFSAIFITFGVLAGFLGSALAPYRIWLTRIGGIVVILFGLFMLNVFKIPFLLSEKQLRIPGVLKRGRPISSFALGAAFGFGWTPCVGPILGSVLLLASASATALEGGFLLLVFSLGLAIPFLAIAAGISSASHYVGRFVEVSSQRKFRVATLIIFGVILGFLLNPLVDAFVARLGGSPPIGLGTFPNIKQYILPLITILVLGGIGYVKNVNAFSIGSGLLLIYFGILLFTNNFSILISYGYQLFKFINYDRLLDYL